MKKDQNILIVDDEIMVTEFLHAYLINSGCNVYVAHNGADALAMFHHSPERGRPGNERKLVSLRPDSLNSRLFEFCRICFTIRVSCFCNAFLGFMDISPPTKELMTLTHKLKVAQGFIRSALENGQHLHLHGSGRQHQG